MKLYKPVTITSTEHAASLPIGTVAEFHDLEDDWHDAAVKIDHNDWRAARSDSVMDWNDAYVVDWTALVPVDAEEDRRENPRRHEKNPRPGEAYLRPLTEVRYITPWERAQ